MNEGALAVYAERLQEENKITEENKTLTSKAAIAHFELAQSAAKLREALNDNLATLRDTNANTLEYALALGEVKEALDNTLNSNVSKEFIEQNLDLIQKMLNGSVDAYQELQKLAAKDWVGSLAISDAEQDAILKFFDELETEVANMDWGKEITLTVNDTQALGTLNRLLQEGTITAEQVQTAFNNMDIEWDATVSSYHLPALTKTYSSAKSPSGEVWTIETINESDTVLPWIGDNPPRYKAVVNADALATIKSSVNSGEEYTYTGDDGNEITVNKSTWGTHADGLIGKVLRKVGSGEASGDLSRGLSKTESLNLTSDIFTANLDDGDSSSVKASYERYHEIKELLSDIERELDLISEAKDRAFGAQHLAYLDQEISKQQQLNAA